MDHVMLQDQGSWADSSTSVDEATTARFVVCAEYNSAVRLANNVQPNCSLHTRSPHALSHLLYMPPLFQTNSPHASCCASNSTQ